MSQSLAPVRSAFRSLISTSSRECRRCISSGAVSPNLARATSRAARIAPFAQRQPLFQKRGKSYKTVEQAKSKYRSGPFSWKAGVLFLVTGAGLTWYFEYEKQRMQRKRIADATKGIGKPKVGGPFELIDQNGDTFSSEDMKGRYALVYFGFTHCPDICPDELDKMARMFDLVEAKRPGSVIPLFITCDPERDTPKVIKDYLAEFHPSFIGLTGTYEQIKAMCKAYRVYFSTPQNVKAGQDYLVDHSIYFYLMDPEGDFVEALGRQHSPRDAAKVILDHMNDWEGEWKMKRR